MTLYSHDTQGLGHMRRNLALAEALAGEHECTDLAPDQVIVGEHGQVAIVDLDQAAIGDPAADLAGFAAAAEHDVVAGRLDPERRDALLDGFAAGYESACGQPGRAPAPRVAASLVRLAPEPFRRRDPAWPAFTRALVERAEELAHG